jgi:serine/threonine-protein kinase PknK
MEIRFPPRYERIAVLGRGGGGQVWATRDRLTGLTVALKALGEGATEREMQALVREAVVLSGLEGLGFPRVLRFGRLPDNARAYMVRELVDGRSLSSLTEAGSQDSRVCLDAVARAGDQLTGLHRAGQLHGDVKPANIIVTNAGGATLVDLGLAAPWREGGTRPVGLTPQYAAPELFAGMPLTVRAEIYALGATLAEVLDASAASIDTERLAALRGVARRAMHEEPAARYPSADELVSSLRHAARIPIPSEDLAVDAAWPVVGVDAAANLLLTHIATLARGAVVAIDAKHGSGRTVLLRRAAWTLGVEGRDVAWIEQQSSLPVLDAIEMELGASSREEAAVVLVDDAEHMPQPALDRLAAARAAGAKVVMVSTVAAAARLGGPVERFAISPLETSTAASLVHRAIPSLSEGLVSHVIARSEGRPGRLRAIVRAIGRHPVVSSAEVDRLLEAGAPSRISTSAPSELQQVETLLDQGRFEEGASVLAAVKKADALGLALVRVRLALGRSEAGEALSILSEIEQKAKDRGGLTRRRWTLQMARALLGLGRYTESAEFAGQSIDSSAMDSDPSLSLEARAYMGLAKSYAGEHEEAEKILRSAGAEAHSSPDRRVCAVVLSSLATGLLRADKLAEARRAYEEALDAAEAAGDAGTVGSTRLNLAVVGQSEGDLAGAIKHLEAAIDMGRRAGCVGVMRYALLNLANLDIYLGRYARARSSVAALAEQRDRLDSNHRAQLVGLEAELAGSAGDIQGATSLYEQCAVQYDSLGRHLDAAEARLEAVLIASRSGSADPVALSRIIERAMAALGDSTAHRALLHLAKGAVAALQNDEDRAKAAYDDALSSARALGQKEWVWRTLQSRSRLLYEMGQALAGRRDGEEALAVLEEIATRLPRDLREVYWDDPRRRALRASQLGTAQSAKAESVPLAPPGADIPDRFAARATRSVMSATIPVAPVDDRLMRLLEINRELAREHDLSRLLERVTDHAISLLNAERGFVILSKNGELVVHTSRDRRGEDPHAHFSRSIAERVIASGEPIVTLSASNDERMANYMSVHQLNVQSVACVPIRTPEGTSTGALYLETRMRPGALFHAELPTLLAFADQAAIAIENAHLVNENRQRADELSVANDELIKARARLEELLGQRTAQLESTRRNLKTTRAVLQSHFGYHGLVGTSETMRRVYALIDRVRDMDVPVLITGESGTGKEVVARAIHSSGTRAKRPFTGINCGAIPEHLLESELFGHLRGAFTGADRDRRGLFRETEEGTILLDEIGEMPSKMQAGLLRVLQEHVVRPIGGVKEETVNCRVITATNRDLEQLVAEGAFREDLYYRLHVVEVHLPPLRERPTDIPMLIDHFMQIFAARHRRERKTLSREALRYLCNCPWPGNVRQLENTLLNAWVMSDRPELDEQDFELAGLRRTSTAPSDHTVPDMQPAPRSREATYTEHQASEREKILAALASCNWNRVRAAEIVGIPRRTFYRRLKKHGIQ